jgi:FKBP-type peptidyl-prolyl cis-trans isomerase (trigger factor)
MKELDDKTKIDLDNVAKKRAQLNIIYMKITEENKIEVKEQEIQDFISKADTETQNNLIAKIKEDKKYLNHVKNTLLENAIIKLIVSKCKKNKVKKSFLEVVN